MNRLCSSKFYRIHSFDSRFVAMFMLARRRREAERQKKLEEAFREADENGNGRITPQQMIKLFAANDCAGEYAMNQGQERGYGQYITHRNLIFWLLANASKLNI